MRCLFIAFFKNVRTFVFHSPLYYIYIYLHIHTRVPCEYCWAAVRSHLHGWMHLGVANARSHTCHFPDICSNYSKFLFVHDGNRFATNIKLLYCNWNRYDNGLYLSSFSLCLLLHFALLFHFGASTTPSRGP